MLRMLPLICVLLILSKSCSSIQEDVNIVPSFPSTDTTNGNYTDIASDDDEISTVPGSVDVVEYFKEKNDFFSNIDQTGEYYEVKVDQELTIPVGAEQDLKPGYYQVDLINEVESEYNSISLGVTNENFDYPNPLADYSTYCDGECTKSMVYLTEGGVVTLKTDEAMTLKFNPANVEANINNFNQNDSGVYFGNGPLIISTSLLNEYSFFHIKVYEYDEGEWVYHLIDVWNRVYKTGPEPFDTESQSMRKFRVVDKYVFKYQNPYIILID